MPFDNIRRSRLTYDEWREKLQLLCARYQLSGIDRGHFTGWLLARSIWGLEAIDLGCNAPRIERTSRDVRLDEVDYYYLLFQCAGQIQLEQNDRTSVLNVGDVALVDSSRPLTWLPRGPNQWLSLHLERKALVSHLGFEPSGGQARSGKEPPVLLLRNLVSDAVAADQTSTEENNARQTSAYLRLAVFDLVGALFADPARVSISPYSDKLFARACDIVRERFSDPNFGPSALAAEMGISLRYLQTLFAVRGGTCSQFIQSSRLDHAVNLLRRRALVGTSGGLRDIAYASGFFDYNYFARLFRRRFGHSPVAHGRGVDATLWRQCPETQGSVKPKTEALVDVAEALQHGGNDT